jgi:RNA polymerase sigma-54 factor
MPGKIAARTVRVVEDCARPDQYEHGAIMQQTLILRASQQFALTPRIVQAIRLLQLSAADLEHEVEEALAANPFLERIEGSDQWPATDARSHGASGAEPSEPQAVSAAGSEGGAEHVYSTPAAAARSESEREIGEVYAARMTLRDHLVEQLAGCRLALCDRLLVEMVIDALDDDGYLRQSVEELLSVAPPDLGAASEDLEVAVRFVQSLDPAGVAARSVAECLALQLERLPESTQGRSIALRIVREQLDLLALHDAARLAAELECEVEAVQCANVLIRSLNPRPGAQFGEVQCHYVVAEVLVRKRGGKWTASINPKAVPNIRVNTAYANALRSSRDGKGALAQHVQEARWLMHNVRQRFETIRRVTQAIVDRQRLYFEHGELAMRPLMLRDVAQELGLHVSTISRVTHNKYMDAPGGLVELKRFFTSRVTDKASGAARSSAAIRALIRELVAAENPQDPVSDVQITRLLASRGVGVARRTVAKYRDALQIPPVEARRLAVTGRCGPTRPRPIAALVSKRNGGLDSVAQTPHQAAPSLWKHQ